MRCLVLSDIHSNLEAFQAVLDDAGSVEEVWCLGDVVGYGPDPNACVELLRSLPHQCLAGNHDWATLGRLDLEDFNSDARQANLWNREQLTAENLAYLGDLPQVITAEPFTLVHGSPRYPIWEYIIDAFTAEANFDHFDTPYCFVGHTHTPVIFRQNLQSEEDTGETVLLPPNAAVSLGPERLIINPGSVGQPRDGNPAASYALVDLETLSIEHHRVRYPLEETRAKMVEHDLPIRLAVRLGYGW
jgi:diadenosine tetraphosphatase ApaH/serine/threonine PP2A family protein phosphatase